MSSPILDSSTNLHMNLRHQGPLDDGHAPSTQSSKTSWWKSAIVYQIWPASFCDSDGDGLGDLPGIISKLDYLKSLGVDTIWLSPMYDSPQEDMGYDISDYNAIYPPYGTMDDMDNLIKGLHDRGMKIILDLVVNHTSDQHHWFKESRKSRHGKYADWYIWRDAKKGKNGEREPPNNWGSVFTGSAWKWAEERQQYYLHLFAEGQPDLNWENRELREAIHQYALKYWFDKGVDGFRIDTCNIYSKDQGALERDGPVRPGRAPYGDFEDGVVNAPGMHEIWQEIRKKVLNNYGDPLMVGELALSTFEETLKYVGRKPRELSMVFDFTYSELGRGDGPPHEVKKYKLTEAKKALQRTQDYAAEPLAWTSIFVENHDRPRSVSYHGSTNPKYWEMAAKLLGIMTSTLSGTLFLYQGQECGMTNIPSTWSPSDLKDIAAINYWNTLKESLKHDKAALAKAWKGLTSIARDNARTPVQWSSEKNAGFTTGTPWMRVNENYKEGINIADQSGQKDSVLGFWKQLLEMRKGYEDLFVFGGYEVLDFENEQTWSFEKMGKKKHDGERRRAWVVLNFSEREAEVDVPEWAAKLVLMNLKKGEELGKKLRAFEGRVYVSE